MDRLRQQLLKHAPSGFDHLPVGGLQKMDPRLHWAFRVRLSQWQKRALCFLEDIFQGVIVMGLVSGNPGSFGQVKVIPLHSTRITVAARGQEELHRLTCFGDHQLRLETVEETLFTGLATPPDFPPVSFRTGDAIVVAGRDGKAVDDVNRVFVQVFPGLAQHAEQGQE